MENKEVITHLDIISEYPNTDSVYPTHISYTPEELQSATVVSMRALLVSMKFRYTTVMNKLSAIDNLANRKLTPEQNAILKWKKIVEELPIKSKPVYTPFMELSEEDKINLLTKGVMLTILAMRGHKALHKSNRLALRSILMETPITELEWGVINNAMANSGKVEHLHKIRRKN